MVAVLLGVALTFADSVPVPDQSALLRFVNKDNESAKEAEVPDLDVAETSYKRHKHGYGKRTGGNGGYHPKQSPTIIIIKGGGGGYGQQQHNKPHHGGNHRKSNSFKPILSHHSDDYVFTQSQIINSGAIKSIIKDIPTRTERTIISSASISDHYSSLILLFTGFCTHTCTFNKQRVQVLLTPHLLANCQQRGFPNPKSNSPKVYGQQNIRD